MAHTFIKRIISKQKKGKIWITTIEDGEGNEATGINPTPGHSYHKDDLIYTYFDDRYNRIKFRSR